MAIEVKFSLADDGDKWFLTSVFIELEDEGTIAIGVSKRNGDCYAFTRITKKQFLSAIKLLGLLEED